MKTKHKFFVMEGIMGSGKTTLAHMLANELGGVYYNTPESFKVMRVIADRELSLQARYQFYLSLNMQVSQEVKGLLRDNIVVCDKYVWSTYCYHKAFGLDIPNFPELDIIFPDSCFLICCDDEVRLGRISRRDPFNDYSKDFKRQENERRCLGEYKKVLPDCVIDNSFNDPKVALSKILSITRRE